MPEKVTVSAKIDEALDARINVLTERVGWSKSELIAHCLEYGVREGEKFADRIEGPVLGHLLRMVFMLDADDPAQRKAFDEVVNHVRDFKKRRNASLNNA